MTLAKTREQGVSAMTEPVLIRQLTLRNLLSFGPASRSVPLGALNVLVGANGSGKSNFIDGISLLQAAPRALASPISEGGGITEWIYKGGHDLASIEALIDFNERHEPLRHEISFREHAQRFQLVDERVEDRDAPPHPGDNFIHYGFRKGYPAASAVETGGARRAREIQGVELDSSILAQLKDPEQFPEITYLGRQYQRIRIYRDWSFGRRCSPSAPQPSDLPNDQLSEDFRNLALVMNRFQLNPEVRGRVEQGIKDFMHGVSTYRVLAQGGTVQLFLEADEFAIPAPRLSDGTIRYLCLLVILLHPEPPPLVCIEEPELGLHPDVLPALTELMVDASRRTQLVVTTHSDMIINALSDRPEAVLVCEKHEGQSQIRRLDGDELKPWLEKYRLGQLWVKGEIGGTRW